MKDCALQHFSMSSVMQRISAFLRRLSVDNFTIMLLCTVALASVLPCSGQTAVVLGNVTTFAIGLLFFLHGAKLSREAMLSGLTHWRLHLLVLASTFVMFPLLGLAMKPCPAIC
jgi:sodium/bile acid cotransporter 7